MNRGASILIAVLAFAPTASAAKALDIRMNANASEVMVGETFQLDVVVTRKRDASVENLKMPDLSDFRIVQDSHSSQQSWNLGGGRREITLEDRYTYLLRADAPGKKRIGAASGALAGQTARAPSITIKVLKSGQKRTQKARGAYFIEARTDKQRAFVGEQVLLTVDVYTEQRVDIKDLKMPKLDQFWEQTIDQSRIKMTTRTIGAKQYSVYTAVKTLIFPLKPGVIQIGEVTATVQASSGFWRRGKSYLVRSDPIVLEVEPLPGKDRPVDFHDGNIGLWRMDAAVEPKRTSVGQAVTLTLRVRGRGNVERVVFPELPEEVRGARLFPPTYTSRTQVNRDSLRGERTAQILIQPLGPGRITIPPLTLEYFNPQSGRYETQRTQRIDVPVSAAAKSGASTTGGGQVVRGGAAPTYKLRPIKTGLTLAAPLALYRRGWFWPAALALLGVALAGATALRRRRSHAASTAQRRAHAKKTRQATLSAARDAKDLTACRRVIEDALAARFGEDIRALDGERRAAALAQRDAGGLVEDVGAFLDAAEAALYAPAEGKSRRELFDTGAALLARIDGDAS